MNKGQGHPNEDELLPYLDGELDSLASESIRNHLDSCWTCRMRASSIQTAILEYARERERAAVPAPPAPWRDLGGDFRRVHELARPPSLLRRFRMGAIFCGAAAALAAVTWFALPHQEIRGTTSPVLPAVSIPAARPRVAELRTPELAKTRNIYLPDRYAITHEELAIVAELHALKADLGEPIDLTHTAEGRLRLTASGLSRERTEEIRRALSRFLALTIHFTEPHARAAGPEPSTQVAARTRPIAFEQELVQYAGGRQALQKLSNSMLEASDRITMYTHAIHNLDQRFPTASLSIMDDDDRMLLRRIRADYQSGARQGAHALRKLLDPIFGSLGIESNPEAGGDLLEAALQVDRLLNAGLAGAQSDLNDRDLYSDLRGWYTRLMELCP